MRRRYAPAFCSAWTRTAAATLLVAVMPAASRAEQGSGAPSAAAVAHKAAADRFEALGTPKFPARLADLGLCLDVRKALVRYSLNGLWADLLPRAAAERIVIAS